MFRPLVVDGRLWVDGGVSDRSGSTALRGDARVLLHYIPSRRRVRWRRPPPPPRAFDRTDTLTLITPDLPRVTPFRLSAGPEALARTRTYVQRWLDEKLEHRPGGSNSSPL
jgi:hypothetical protein